MLKLVSAAGLEFGAHRPTGHRFRVGLVAALVCWLVGGSIEARAAEPGDATSAATQSRYNCYIGGFCGSEGWGYGIYADDTKESTGCDEPEEAAALWDQGVLHVPPLPDFALPRCTFFYDFRSCSLPTVICLN